MRYFPVFLDTRARPVLVVGGGETAVAKLRLLSKSDAAITVFAPHPAPEILAWAAAGALTVEARPLTPGDVAANALVYAAEDDADRDARTRAIGRSAGALVNVVDNLTDSDFLTPAIVDRDPVTVAIGTEGAAPVLARRIKADVEAMLPAALGQLTRIARGFRDHAARLPAGRARRAFWSRFFFGRGPDALRDGGTGGAEAALESLFADAGAAGPASGRVVFVGAGPGDPDLLTRKALAALHDADVVIHDRLVSAEILELARREARLIEAGKTGFGQSWLQDDINAEMVRQAAEGQLVVRLKGGDPTIFGRLDEETAALRAAGVPFEVVPGITAASAAAAGLGQSLTSRGRNSGYRVLTAHDLDGFAELDWRALAQPGAVATVYMGKRAATFLSGRLLMHGADPQTAVTAVENVSRVNQRVVASTLARLGADLAAAAPSGPVVLLVGVAAGEAAAPAGQQRSAQA